MASSKDLWRIETDSEIIRARGGPNGSNTKAVANCRTSHSGAAETTANGRASWDSVKVVNPFGCFALHLHHPRLSLSLQNKALTCPPLIKPANGSVSPLSCATGDAAPNQRCYFTCDPGFRVTGNPVRACLPSLKWNPLRPPPACEKGNNSFLFFITSPFKNSVGLAEAFSKLYLNSSAEHNHKNASAQVSDLSSASSVSFLFL